MGEVFGTDKMFRFGGAKEKSVKIISLVRRGLRARNCVYNASWDSSDFINV